MAGHPLPKYCASGMDVFASNRLAAERIFGSQLGKRDEPVNTTTVQGCSSRAFQGLAGQPLLEGRQKSSYR